MDDVEKDLAGPKTLAMLHLQVAHRSHRVWTDPGFVDTEVVPVRYDSRIPAQFRDPRVTENLRQVGFYGVHRVHPIRLDHGLITALMERWRPEVHAFHFPFEEMGITLQDVECLMGLAVDGLPVLGAPALLPDQRDEVFRDILGWEVDGDDFGRPDQFKISKLGRREQPDAHWTDEQVKQYTAGVIYGYLGGLLFPDTSGRYVATDFVPLLEDFDHTSQYSWGSAVLARLYCSLCRTSLRTNEGTRLGGCALLLQLWAWTRFLPIRPVVRDLPNDRHGPLFFDDPHGARWRVRKSYAHTARNNVRYFRDQFDGALYRHVDWEPYDVDSLPAYCKAGQRLWSFEGIIIYRWHVEPIMSRRFARQFGRLQTIPELPYLYDADNHKSGGTASSETLSAYIREWREDRYDHVVLDQMEALPSPHDTGEHLGQGYRDWFAFYGRRLIRNPAHHHDNGAESSAAALVVAVNAMTRVRDLLEACPEDPNDDAGMTLTQCRDALTLRL